MAEHRGNRWAIWDLDNCLANDAWRIPLVDWSDGLDPLKRYAAYHAACEDDLLCHSKIFIAVNLIARPIFLTGRPSVVRSQTEQWIFSKLGILQPFIMMRGNTDNSTSLALKRKMLKDLPYHGQVVAAFDDRPEIVQMYCENGIPAMQLKIHDVDAYTHPVTKLERP